MDTAVKQEPAHHMAAPEIEFVPVAACTPSPTNPRKRFDKNKLAELAESIKLHGVLQPILVRRVPEKGAAGVKYEIVAGERRWKATRQAGLAHVPVWLRELTDVQVLELQLTENLQRDDLDPLEEADGYKQLMALKRINADQLAELLGKSRSYVYTRTKLNDLCPEARRALTGGDLDASRALLISRIGHHDTQRQALKDALAGHYGRGPMTYRELQKHIAEEYMLKLSGAPFDPADEALVPKAGSCAKCPKRTGNQPDLFGDIKSGDLCTDPKCFDDKRQAHFGAARKHLEAQGNKVIAGDAAKKIVRNWDDDRWDKEHLDGGYVPLDYTTYATGKDRKVSEILPADFKPVLIQHPRTGRIIKAATQKDIAGAAHKVQGKPPGATPAESRPMKPKGPYVDEQLLERLIKLMHEKTPDVINRLQLQVLARQVLRMLNSRSDELAIVARVWGWRKSDFSVSYYGGAKLPKQAAGLGVNQLMQLIFDLVFIDRANYDRKPILALFKLDEAELRDLVIKERRDASAAARATKKAKPAAKGKKT